MSVGCCAGRSYHIRLLARVLVMNSTIRAWKQEALRRTLLHSHSACSGRPFPCPTTENVEKVQVVALQRLCMKKPQKKFLTNSLSILALPAPESRFCDLWGTKLFQPTPREKPTKLAFAPFSNYCFCQAEHWHSKHDPSAQHISLASGSQSSHKNLGVPSGKFLKLAVGLGYHHFSKIVFDQG